MENMQFKENDFVWAKLAGFSHWPAIVMKPHPEAPTRPGLNTQWVYFLGTHNYAWIEDKNIKPYEEYKIQFKKKNTQAAMEEMEEIMKNMAEDPDYKIEFAKYVVPKRASPKKRKSDAGTPIEKKRPFLHKDKSTSVSKKKSRLSSTSDDRESIKAPEKPLIPLSESELKARKQIVLDTVNLGTSRKFIGFLAGNVYAEGIIKNLIISGHRLYVWSRSSTMCEELRLYAEKQQSFFQVCNSPKQVVRNSDITFSCLSGPDEASQVVRDLAIADKSECLLKDKGYVEMTSIDPELSQDFDEIITSKDGFYLEAMLQGNKQETNKGEMIVLAAGLQKLFVECQSCFKAISKASFLLGKVGSASKIHMIFQMMKGVFLASLAEGFALAERCSITLEAFNNIFKMTHMSSEYLKNKSDTIVHKQFSATEEPVQQLQKDLAQGLQMSTKFRQPMLLASNANEILKNARRLGYDDQDSACIYNRTR